MQWHEVVGHLQATHQVASAADRWVELCWRFSGGNIPIRQQQTIWPTEVNGEPYLVIASEVSMPRRARAGARLQRRNGIGQLVEDGDSFQLRLTLPTRGLALSTLDHLLLRVAQEAAQLSAAPRPRQSDSFSAASVS